LLVQLVDNYIGYKAGVLTVLEAGYNNGLTTGPTTGDAAVPVTGDLVLL